MYFIPLLFGLVLDMQGIRLYMVLSEDFFCALIIIAKAPAAKKGPNSYKRDPCTLVIAKLTRSAQPRTD